MVGFHTSSPNSSLKFSKQVADSVPTCAETNPKSQMSLSTFGLQMRFNASSEGCGPTHIDVVEVVLLLDGRLVVGPQRQVVDLDARPQVHSLKHTRAPLCEHGMHARC